MPNTYITFIAADALYEDGGPLHGSDQPDCLPLGPFSESVQLTYADLRVGAEGDVIAHYGDGLWRVGEARVPDGSGWRSLGPCEHSLLFSDVTITVRETEPTHPLSEYIRIVAEYSTAHITKATNDLLFDHALSVPDDQHSLPRQRSLPLTVLRTGHGFFISVPTDTADGRNALGQLPTDVSVLLTLARNQHADWLLLDGDGPVHENLTRYDW
jgi:hypothetical protein